MAHFQAPEPDLGEVLHHLRGMRLQGDEAAVSAQEQLAGAGVLGVGVVAEFSQFDAGRVQIGLCQGVGGVVLHQAAVGAQPDDAVTVFEDAVDHVVDKACLSADVLRLDVLAGIMQAQKARYRSHVEAAVRGRAKAQDVVDGLVVEIAHGDDAVFVGLQVQPHQAVPAAAGVKHGVSGGFQGMETL